MKINPSKLFPCDIIATRSQTKYGKAIRAILGSYTNHNAMAVEKDGKLMIGEAVSPVSRLTTIDEYNSDIAAGLVVRVWRVSKPGITTAELTAVNDYFIDNLIGIKYPLSVARLWVYRFVNNLPWTIHGEWCTRIVWDAWSKIVPDVLDRPDGKKKKNPTPRTLENRLVAGVLVDVTNEVIN